MLAAFGVRDRVPGFAGLRLPFGGFTVAREGVRSGERLVAIGEIPVADPVLLAVPEAALRMPDRRLRPPVDARDLPLAAREVLRLALLRLAPVVSRRLRDMQEPVVVLPRLHQSPGLVEEVDAAPALLAHSSSASETARSRISSTTIGSASVVVSPSRNTVSIAGDRASPRP